MTRSPPESANAFVTPISSAEGMVWPAVPNASHAWSLAVRFQLDRTQWWSVETLRQQQRNQLAKLVQHAEATVPFYRGRLAADLGDAENGQWKEAWSELPILTHSDVQYAQQELVCRDLPNGHGDMRELRTSGSTG